MALRVSLAGGDGDGIDVDSLRGRRARVALTVLVVERKRPVARDELAEIVWPQGPPPTWKPALRTVLSRVRAFLREAGLGDDLISAQSGTYQLHLPDEVEVDLEVAVGQLEEAEGAMRRGDVAGALDAAVPAREILARPLLPGADTPWADRRRDEMRALLVRAREAEAQARACRGEHAAAVEALEAALDVEPLNESAYRALMEVQATAGNRALALQAHERCRRLLAEELGVSPAAATQAVYLRILRGELSAARTEPARPLALDDQDALAYGRAALAEHNWEDAFVALSRADDSAPLAPQDLEGLGEAAMWTGRHGEAITARTRAHVAYLDDGDRAGAARVAMALVANHAIRMQFAAAEGWFRTAADLVADEPDGPPHGFLAFLAAVMSLDTGELEGCLDAARRATELGRRYEVADLEALGLTFQGCALVRLQSLHDGLALLDQAMAQATTGRLGPLATGLVYCRTIWTCVDLGDYRRAGQWIEQVEDGGTATGFRGYVGDCHAHRSAVLVVRGSWSEAEREAERACQACQAFDLTHVGLASYGLGLVRLRRGDLNGAEAAFEQANEHGTVPQPGLALLHLARGDIAGAQASIRTALGLSPPGTLERARLLPVAARIALHAADDAALASAADDLEQIVAGYPIAAHLAGLALARGMLHHLRAEVKPALKEFRCAVDHYLEAEAPYETAYARVDLAASLDAAGDAAGARLELNTAQSVFERLGARPDAARAAERLRDLDAR